MIDEIISSNDVVKLDRVLLLQVLLLQVHDEPLLPQVQLRQLVEHLHVFHEIHVLQLALLVMPLTLF